MTVAYKDGPGGKEVLLLLKKEGNILFSELIILDAKQREVIRKKYAQHDSESEEKVASIFVGGPKTGSFHCPDEEENFKEAVDDVVEEAIMCLHDEISYPFPSGELKKLFVESKPVKDG